MTNKDAWLYISNLWQHPVQGNFGQSEKTFTGIQPAGKFIVSLFDSVRAMVSLNLITPKQCEHMLDDLMDYCLGSMEKSWSLTPAGAAIRAQTCLELAGEPIAIEEDL